MTDDQESQPFITPSEPTIQDQLPKLKIEITLHDRSVTIESRQCDLNACCEGIAYLIARLNEVESPDESPRGKEIG